MPFVQMENISHFLRACQSSPLNLQPHDVFQTVDLFESKDPAQVLQCICAFSRRAHTVNPAVFTNAIGGKSKIGLLSPQSTGGYSSDGGRFSKVRDVSTSDASSVTSNLPSRGIGGKHSPTRSSGSGSSTPVNGGVSSWSKRADEAATTPAWNIHQYGYMGGASQGNQGIMFGARRQITTPAPKVPSLAEKERKKRESEAEAERLQVLAEEAEHRRRVEREAEEERDRIAEEQRWIEETRQQREREKAAAEAEKRKWEEEERKWKEEDEARLKEEREVEARFDKERQQKKPVGDSRLQGQFLSEYQAGQRQRPLAPNDQDSYRKVERDRIKELELELERAKERERQYERERQERLRLNQAEKQYDVEDRNAAKQLKEEAHHDHLQGKPRPLPTTPLHSHQSSEDPWRMDEQDYLRREWATQHTEPPRSKSRSPPPPPQLPRPLPLPQSSNQSPITRPKTPPPPNLPVRPLPDPKSYSPVKAPTFPSKPSSLLSREMELDRLRQQEWEEAQKATKAAAATIASGESTPAVEGTKPGSGAWDVNQYGYLGGDNQNRGGPGLGVGGRRQIIGPRVEARKSGA